MGLFFFSFFPSTVAPLRLWISLTIRGVDETRVRLNETFKKSLRQSSGGSDALNCSPLMMDLQARDLIPKSDFFRFILPQIRATLQGAPLIGGSLLFGWKRSILYCFFFLFEGTSLKGKNDMIILKDFQKAPSPSDATRHNLFVAFDGDLRGLCFPLRRQTEVTRVGWGRGGGGEKNIEHGIKTRLPINESEQCRALSLSLSLFLLPSVAFTKSRDDDDSDPSGWPESDQIKFH